MWSLLLFTAAMLIFTLPLLPALLELFQQRDIAPVAINQDNAGNASYFAESFLEVMEQAIADIHAGEENILEGQDHVLIKGDGQFRPDEQEQKTATVNRLLIGLDNIDLPGHFNFNHEIFSRGSINLGAHARIRSALALGDLRLDGHCRLLRWMHAENVEAGSGCLLLGRVSARREIVLQSGCKFQRLNAGRIVVQEGPGGEGGRNLARSSELFPRIPAALPHADRDATGRILLNGNLDFPANGFWQGDMVVRGKALIRRHAWVQGSIKVYGSLTIEPGVVIEGSIVCNRQILIAENCWLAGPVSAEQGVEIGPGSEVGGLKAQTSITAPIIYLHPGVSVYGTVWARQRGEILAAMAGVSMPRNRHAA